MVSYSHEGERCCFNSFDLRHIILMVHRYLGRFGASVLTRHTQQATHSGRSHTNSGSPRRSHVIPAPPSTPPIHTHE